jgi:RNA polymerase sigma factor (sigma-70 family)
MKKDVFQELLANQRHRVYSHAYYVLRNREDAEDITQEVFVRLWHRCPATEWKGILAWMRRVTHNLCIDQTRRRKRAVEAFSPDIEVDMDNLAGQSAMPGDPERDFLLSEQQEALLEALETLPAPTRSMVLLHYFHGLSYREIGETIDTHPTTVKVQVHRARRALKRILSDPELARTGNG